MFITVVHVNRGYELIYHYSYDRAEGCKAENFVVGSLFSDGKYPNIETFLI